MSALAPRYALIVAAVAGLVVELAFPPQGFWPAAIAAIAMLHISLRGQRATHAFAIASVFGIIFMLQHLWWAVAAVGGGDYLPWIALSVVEGLLLGIYGLLAAWIGRTKVVHGRPWLALIALPAAWVSVELLRSTFPFGGLPWGLLAFSQVGGPVASLAQFGGQVLVSAAVVAIGIASVSVLDAAVQLRPIRAGIASAVALSAIVATFYLPKPDTTDAQTLRVGLVQGNVPNPGETGHARQVTANHRQVTEDMAVENPDLDMVFWPESSADIDPRTDDEVAADVDAAARAVGVPIMLGTQRYVDDVRYNEVIVWHAGQGSDGQAYAKQHPVPFGEYMPMRDFFRQLSPHVDRVQTDMVAGADPAHMTALDNGDRQVEVAVGICFEVGYAGIVREGVALGGDLIVIPTNNASHGQTQVSAQQFDMARLRAIEHGRSALQVGTTGVSGVIQPDGSVMSRTDMFTADWLVEDVPLLDHTTLATRLGWWPGLVAVAATGLLIVVRFTNPVPARQTRTRPARGRGGARKK